MTYSVHTFICPTWQNNPALGVLFMYFCWPYEEKCFFKCCQPMIILWKAWNNKSHTTSHLDCGLCYDNLHVICMLVPPKKKTYPANVPWLMTEIKRLIRKKNQTTQEGKQVNERWANLSKKHIQILLANSLNNYMNWEPVMSQSLSVLNHMKDEGI